MQQRLIPYWLSSCRAGGETYPSDTTSHTENAVSGGFDNTDYSALYKMSTSVDGLTGLMFE